MPSSFVDSVPPVVKLLVNINPSKVVDVGPGWGKYGLMTREYCNPVLVDAVEVSQGRLFTQDVIYDNIFDSDVRKLSGDFWENYDLVLMIDVIEHLTIEEGQKILEDILNCNTSLIVSTPKVWDSQEGDTNPYEKHLSLWDWTMFPHPFEDVSTIDSLIFLIKP